MCRICPYNVNTIALLNCKFEKDPCVLIDNRSVDMTTCDFTTLQYSHHMDQFCTSTANFMIPVIYKD